MDQPFLGLIAIFGFNFAPRGWMFCSGQLLSIAENTALFSLLGTTYGGDGQTTFGLPDFRGRAPIGQFQGTGLSSYVLGETAGSENITLLSNQMPAHTHTLNGMTEAGTSATPTGNLLANSGALDKEYSTPGTLTTMRAQAIGIGGSNLPHDNIQPYLTLNYCIAIEGIFPSRN